MPIKQELRRKYTQSTIHFLQDEIVLSGKPYQLSIPDHVHQRHEQRFYGSQRYFEISVKSILQGIDQLSPGIFNGLRTFSVLDYQWKLCIALHIQGNILYVKTIGQVGSFWPKNNDITIIRYANQGDVHVKKTIWKNAKISNRSS